MAEKKGKTLTANDITDDGYNVDNIIGMTVGGMIALIILITSIFTFMKYLGQILILLIGTIIVTEIASRFVLRYFKKNDNNITEITLGGSIVIKLLGVIWGFISLIAIVGVGGLILGIITLVMKLIDYINLNPKIVLMYSLVIILLTLVVIIIGRLNHEWYNNYLKKK